MPTGAGKVRGSADVERRRKVDSMDGDVIAPSTNVNNG